MKLTLDELRQLGWWAAACAGRVRPLFATKKPADTRLLEALAGIRAFARGGKRTARLRVLALAAFAVAREVDDPAHQAAARSVGLAASSAYTHPLPSASQAKHILGPAVYAARACELARGPEAGQRELRRAVHLAPPTVRRLLARFPRQPPGRTRLASLYAQLDAGLRRPVG